MHKDLVIFYVVTFFFFFFNDLVPKKEIKMNKELTELVLFATIPKFIFDDKIIKRSYCNI
jgi:hypothetical protein